MRGELHRDAVLSTNRGQASPGSADGGPVLAGPSSIVAAQGRLRIWWRVKDSNLDSLRDRLHSSRPAHMLHQR
jgi:hypothetical protein